MTAEPIIYTDQDGRQVDELGHEIPTPRTSWPAHERRGCVGPQACGSGQVFVCRVAIREDSAISEALEDRWRTIRRST